MTSVINSFKLNLSEVYILVAADCTLETSMETQFEQPYLSFVILEVQEHTKSCLCRRPNLNLLLYHWLSM